MKLKQSTMMTILCVVVWACVFQAVSCHLPGDLRLVDNGYEGLVVSISEDLPQQHCNQILHGLKFVLTEFSGELHKATGGRASLREVTVALPRTWQTDTLSCSLLGPLNSAAVPTSVHLRVSNPHPVFGANPWVQQSQGCGHHGDFIQLGSDLLRATKNDSYIHAAKMLMGVWPKFRWGVFDEQGYNDDPLYPAFYRDPISGEMRINNCKDEQHPICDEHDHVPEAPNKHNAQCQGKAAWEVIMSSQDFKDKRNIPTNSSKALIPKLNFVQTGEPRIIIVVEDTAVMNLQKRWEFIRKALRRVVVYDMPDDIYVGVVVFNSVARTTASLAMMDSVSDVRQRIGSSMPRNPSSVPEKHKCLLCGIQEALRALDIDPQGAEGATIILLTSGAGATPKREIDEMIRLSTVRGIHIEAIIYPFIEQQTEIVKSHGLEKLVSTTHGSTFTVMDEGVGNDSKINMMMSLMNSLLATVRKACLMSSSGASLMIHSKAYHGGESAVARGSFTIDDSIISDARFAVYYYDITHVGNTLELTTPSGNIMSSVNMQEEDGDANVIFMNIPMAERGEWHYQVENRADSHQGLQIEVTSKESENRKIKLHVWINSDNGANNSSDPIIIYAEIKDGMLPVLNAKVTAKFQQLGMNANGKEYSPIYFDLFDNGLGDPDITEGDGVYSRYLPILSHENKDLTHYELGVTANNNNGLAIKPLNNILSTKTQFFVENKNKSCCGSTIEYEHVTPIPPFQRTEMFGVIGLLSNPSGEDTVPPNRILDLQADINLESHEISFHWTAPGDDYDWGQANHYEAVMAASLADAFKFNGERINGMPIPLNVGVEQSITINTTKYDQLVYVVIRAVDEVGNHGEVSNMVSIFVSRPPTTTTKAPPSTSLPFMDFNDMSNDINSRNSEIVRSAGLKLDDMAIVIGSVSGFLIIVAVFATFCFFHVARHQRQHHKKNNEILEVNKNSMVKSNSVSMFNENERADSEGVTMKVVEVKSVKGYPISSMPSWSPSILLQEHEKRCSVTSSPPSEDDEILTQYQNFQDQFPELAQNGSHSYPNSQSPSITQSDPPAYQTSYTSEVFDGYQYSYNPGYCHEELPPYSPQGMCSQTSQFSTKYSHETPQHSPDLNYVPNTNPYQNKILRGVSSRYGQSNTSAAMYSNNHQPKLAPPVSPKPSLSVHTTIANTEPMRRNITQV
ncbi:unnamed protein product [Meganyctiphanes norvegica]|uniref:Calcium-activated chloride channel N-terminal domain-containing protein n=1 Tax=Meganyctiphanes norvegica TaxID=48144 RepID=A0AAV2SC39_MEGNR